MGGRACKKPDVCVRRSDDGDECQGVSCPDSSDSSCSAPCCTLERGDDIYKEEKSYKYHKKWRSKRIDSNNFDNPVAYRNPQRDPAPSTQVFADGNGVDLSGGRGGNGRGPQGLHVSAKDLEPVMEPFKLMLLSEDVAKNLEPHALKAGFGEVSQVYLYSTVPKDGLNNPSVRAGASYLVDGVVDIDAISEAAGIESLLGKAGLDGITKGTCNAGDIRVHFQTRRLPKSISLVGRQTKAAGAMRRLLPHTYATGQTVFLMRRGVMNLQALAKQVMGEAQDVAAGLRMGSMVIFLVACSLGAGPVLRPNSGGIADWPLTFACTGTLFGLSLGVVWGALYGGDDAAPMFVFGGVSLWVVKYLNKGAAGIGGKKHEE